MGKKCNRLVGGLENERRRSELDISREELAERVGTTKSVISRFKMETLILP
jgi:predicted transcriptional regulator